MRFIVILSILFISPALFAQATCQIDTAQIEDRVNEYLEEVQQEMTHNTHIIEFGDGRYNNDPTFERARRVEQKRSQEIQCDVEKLQSQILSPYQYHCKFDETISQCDLAQRNQEVRTLLAGASRALYGLSKLGQAKDSGKAMCQSLGYARSELVNARNTLYSTRERLFKTHKEFVEGNKACDAAAQRNLLSDACLQSFNKDHSKWTYVANQEFKRRVREGCKPKHVALLRSRLTGRLFEGAEKTCQIVSGHQQSVKNQRDLEHMYKTFDRSIASIDKSIVGVNRTGKQGNCDLKGIARK